MGRHRRRYVCPRCRKRKVPHPNALCYGCSEVDPRLPRLDRDEPRRPGQAAKPGGA